MNLPQHLFNDLHIGTKEENNRLFHLIIHRLWNKSDIKSCTKEIVKSKEKKFHIRVFEDRRLV